ncbi:hypothetical protein [Aliiroseovarius sp. F47248L]|uniref:hypothetical protein n=1 Tax=Aliiroseovarius sp. F47248L TaxID=2926420 RepID=UPI001FF43FC1|nr:hypothetical protein [Aliiroseovarius sp. F47248L]MCK0137894.1 hypothetical protein [Aliiroseovarius sp. F47248L]
MKIYSADTGQVAYKVKSRSTGKAQYDCYLKNRPNNEKTHAISFDTIEEAARFLIDNPGSGIRMNPGTAIISENVIIARDE